MKILVIRVGLMVLLWICGGFHPDIPRRVSWHFDRFDLKVETQLSTPIGCYCGRECSTLIPREGRKGGILSRADCEGSFSRYVLYTRAFHDRRRPEKKMRKKYFPRDTSTWYTCVYDSPITHIQPRNSTHRTGVRTKTKEEAHTHQRYRLAVPIAAEGH